MPVTIPRCGGAGGSESGEGGIRTPEPGYPDYTDSSRAPSAARTPLREPRQRDGEHTLWITPCQQTENLDRPAEAALGRSLKNHRPDLGGVLVVDKPLGISSAAVCNAVRRRSGGAKVGHAGTLDPLATGVLVVCLGAATKSISDIQASAKRYTADVDLSAFTSTDDAEGERDEIAVSAPPTRDAIERACAGFLGEIDQRPPVYSAVHIEGKRAYDLARKGELAERPAPKRVRIDSIDVLTYDWPALALDIRCGKGVYIRSLARDLGEVLHTGGTLSALRRTAVGGYTIDRATPLDDLPEDAEGWTPELLTSVG